MSYIKGTKDVLVQIATKHLLKKRRDYESTTNENNYIETKLLGASNLITPTRSELTILRKHGIILYNGKLSIFKRLKKNRETFSCHLYIASKRHIDYFVKFKEMKIGMLKYYLIADNIHYAMVELYDIAAEIDHIKEVVETRTHQLITVDSIQGKLMYIESQRKRFLIEPPNKFETD